MNAVYLVRKLPSAMNLFLMPLRRWKAKDQLLGMGMEASLKGRQIS